MKRLLLLSNSTNFGEPFLQYPIRTIQQFLGSGRFRSAFCALCWRADFVFGLR